MMEPGMNRPGIDQGSKGHLVDPSQSLIIWVGNDFENKWIINGNETINRVIDDFADISHEQNLGAKNTLGKLSVRANLTSAKNVMMGY